MVSCFVISCILYSYSFLNFCNNNVIAVTFACHYCYRSENKYDKQVNPGSNQYNFIFINLLFKCLSIMHKMFQFF